MSAPKTSLEEFAASRRKKSLGNWIESIPEAGEVLSAYQSGVSISTIREWLLGIYTPEECTLSRCAYLAKKYPRSRRG